MRYQVSADTLAALLVTLAPAANCSVLAQPSGPTRVIVRYLDSDGRPYVMTTSEDDTSFGALVESVCDACGFRFVRESASIQLYERY